MNKSNYKDRLSLKQRFKLRWLFRRIRRHYKNIDYVLNKEGGYKTGLQYIRPYMDQMYVDENYVLVNGIPLYSIKTKKFLITADNYRQNRLKELYHAENKQKDEK